MHCQGLFSHVNLILRIYWNKTQNSILCDRDFYKAPFYYLFGISWYQEFDFLISRNEFLISRNIFWYEEIFFDIKNSISWYQKMHIKKSNSWYQKLHFLISRNRTHFLISRNRFLDIKKCILRRRFTETFLDLYLLTCCVISRVNYVDILKCSAKSRKIYVDLLKYYLLCRHYFCA